MFALMPSYLPLISAYERFLAEHPGGTLEEFGRHLLEERPLQNQFEDESTDQRHDDALQLYFDANTAEQGYRPGNSEASYLIWRLAKFLKSYTRPLLSKHGLSGQDDFAVLAHVDYLGEGTKKEVAHANLLDVSTGVDLVRRLVRAGHLSERHNPADRRERLISLTPKGKKLLAEIYRGFTSIPDLLVDLDQGERKTIVALLGKLDAAHTAAR